MTSYEEYRDKMRKYQKGVVVFRKLDNTLRKMRFDNTKGRVAGGVYSASHIAHYEPVYDIEANAWRTVNLSTIISLKI